LYCIAPINGKLPINVLLYNGPLFCDFNVAVKGLKPQQHNGARRKRFAAENTSSAVDSNRRSNPVDRQTASTEIARPSRGRGTLTCGIDRGGRGVGE